MTKSENLSISLTKSIRIKMSEYEHGCDYEFDCECERWYECTYDYEFSVVIASEYTVRIEFDYEWT